jgi:Undecaprenyl-phosphate glucose phosphotransferase
LRVSVRFDSYPGADEARATRARLGRTSFAVAAFTVEVATILVVALTVGAAYHLAAYGDVGSFQSYLAVGGIAAFAYTMPFVFREEYSVQSYLEGHREFGRTFFVWNTAFLSLAVVGFLTKSTDLASRGMLVLFYCGGLAALTATAVLTRSALLSLIASHRLTARRIMLVGPEDEIRHVQSEFALRPTGIRIVATQTLPAPAPGETADRDATLARTLETAVEKARLIGVDDVVLLVEWSRTALIQNIIAAFSLMPVAIHLGASSLLGRFSEARVSRLDVLTALSLTAPPLGSLQVAAKRTFDIVLAGLAIILLSPLFSAIAAAIKLTSPGPVFFRQRRRGYNNREFRIWKFRTMTTLDDGPNIEQARVDDARVTAVGRYLRRFNLDELPQLLNVLKGEMSLVGPRPHAVAHDQIYEKRILSYPRRLNMKPGITGWAQVNGFRGRTETDEAMRARVEYDLHYIDNWSILFDLYILALTVLSPKAFRNAH